MHILEADETRLIQNISCTDEDTNFRITFYWPEGVKQVYIYRKQGELTGGRSQILTLHEYRKQGGFIDPKAPGQLTYYIYPFERIDGDDYCYAHPENMHIITATAQSVINYTIEEYQGWRSDKVYSITIVSSHLVPPETIVCVKKEGEPPTSVNDGTKYPFYEPINPKAPFIRQVQADKNEYIQLFIAEESSGLYRLNFITSKVLPGHSTILLNRRTDAP